MAQIEKKKIGLDKSLLVKRYTYSTNKKADLELEIENGIRVVEVKQLAFRTITPQVRVLEPGIYPIKREKTKAVMPLFHAVQTYSYSFVAFRLGDITVEGEGQIGAKHFKIQFVTSFRDPVTAFYEVIGAKEAYKMDAFFELLLTCLRGKTPSFEQRSASLLNGKGTVEVSQDFPEFASYMENHGLSKPKIYFVLS